MILYVNGDSHSAGAEAVHPACFISDNSKYKLDVNNPIWKDEISWSPYPDNLEVSYGKVLANRLDAEFHCHARAAGSNDRIIRTTKEYLKDHNPDIILIGWSTWEREEWYNDEDGEYYQVTAAGTDSVPKKWQERYKNFIVNVDWKEKTLFWHDEIWQVHQFLKSLKIPHLFFNCHSTFEFVPQWIESKQTSQSTIHDWGLNYIRPYDNFNYLDYLVSLNYKHTEHHHFGPDGHSKWAEFLLPYLTRLL